ncbi:DNA/RNA non-specific endonuclease [Aquimarina sp. 2201CG1-2-11]|uniref:DNA/RNA non-specific endonuclease n=1 Tax=Aquimarina discodermiae TaxID=3231043 RepID=UPI00346304AD
MKKRKGVNYILSLLASVLGIGGLANKVLGLVRKVRKRVQKALTKLWLKIKKAGKKIWRKLGFGKKKKKEKEGSDNVSNKNIDIWEDEVPFTSVENEQHTLYFKEKGDRDELYMHSKDDHVENHLNNAKNLAETDSERENVEAGLTYYKKEVLPINVQLSKLENKRVKLLNATGDNTKKIEANDKKIKEKNKKQDEVLLKLGKLFKAIKFEDKVVPTAVKTKVTSKQDSKGRPVHVEASPLTWIAGNTTGSSPYQKPTGWSYAQDVEEIRKGIYIRGHMLNDNIHGPGVTWNLVPITRVINSNMEVQAESKGKEVLKEKHRIMWYKTTVIDYYNNTDNENDKYFPTQLKVEWGSYKDNDVNKAIIDKGNATFSQGKPAMPFNINDLGEKLLSDKLGVDKKFAKAITEERKANGWFNDQDNFEIRMNKYYENRKDKGILTTGIDQIEILIDSEKAIF